MSDSTLITAMEKTRFAVRKSSLKQSTTVHAHWQFETPLFHQSDGWCEDEVRSDFSNLNRV